MRQKLLTATAAAALVAGTVFAAAQTQKQGAGGGNETGTAAGAKLMRRTSALIFCERPRSSNPVSGCHVYSK